MSWSDFVRSANEVVLWERSERGSECIGLNTANRPIIVEKIFILYKCAVSCQGSKNSDIKILLLVTGSFLWHHCLNLHPLFSRLPMQLEGPVVINVQHHALPETTNGGRTTGNNDSS